MSMVSSWSMRTVMMIRHGMVVDVVDVAVVDKSRKLVVVEMMMTVADVAVVVEMMMMEMMIVHF